jgi:tyrosyl-tRNA synthetase
VGYEPSGEIHLGHAMTVQKLMDLQNAGFKVVVLLADIHAYLNEKGDFDEIEKIAEFNKKAFIALGLEEDKTEFVMGSDFQLGRDYVLDVLKMARITTVNRARRSMDEVSRRKDDPMVSQMIYPLMQALDIAHLNVDLAVGGTDQRKIHMLARENLPKLGYKSPICLHTPILLGLDGEKMSSSKGNYISVRDSPEDVERKIRKAYCPAKNVEDNPIIQIVRYHVFPRFGEVLVERDERYGGDVLYESLDDLLSDYAHGKLHPLDLKKAVAKYLNKILDGVREKL